MRSTTLLSSMLLLATLFAWPLVRANSPAPVLLGAQIQPISAEESASVAATVRGAVRPRVSLRDLPLIQMRRQRSAAEEQLPKSPSRNSVIEDENIDEDLPAPTKIRRSRRAVHKAAKPASALPQRLLGDGQKLLRDQRLEEPNSGQQRLGNPGASDQERGRLHAAPWSGGKGSGAGAESGAGQHQYRRGNPSAGSATGTATGAKGMMRGGGGAGAPGGAGPGAGAHHGPGGGGPRR